MKRALTILIAVCLMLAAYAPALAGGATVSLEEVYTGKNVKMANGNAFMTIKFDQWVLMDADGREVNGDLYENLYINSDRDGSWFMVADGEKHKGMLWEDGRLILPCKYSDVACYNDDWAAGKDDASAKIDVCYRGNRPVCRKCGGWGGSDKQRKGEAKKSTCRDFLHMWWPSCLSP